MRWSALVALVLAPPLASELEVSVFGPGVGECVVVHVGYGEWIIVDSCREPRSGRPIALQYLESLGIDVSIAVRLVVASHFHDDHVRGLSDIVSACTSARFVCSAALGKNEFFELIEANRRLGIPSPGTGEFDRILQILESRSPHGTVVSPDWAMDGRRIYQRTAHTPCEAFALSPSSATMTVAHLRIGALVPTTGVRKLPTSDINPNTLSLVMWVCFGNARAILGGDLEENGRPDEGWQAIVASSVRPQQPAGLLKVAHHGSPTAQHLPTWSALLSAEPIAIITPYAKGVRKLPTAADVRWHCDRTPNVYVTSLGLAKSPRSRASVVDRALKRHVKSRMAIGVDLGHVRVRVDAATGTAAAETLGAAYPACITAA